jgi:hypothetical protein
MMRGLLAVIVIMPTTASTALWGQEGPAPVTVRIAALRFAVANGLELPPGDLAVAVETGFERIHVAPSKMGTAELYSQAVAIATATGRGAKTGSAASLLSCRQRACAPATRASVLLIDEPTGSDGSKASVYVRLYEPSDVTEYDAVLSHGVVDVAQKDGQWVGVRFRVGPSKVRIKLPAK